MRITLCPKFNGDLHGVLVQKIGHYQIIPSSTHEYGSYSKPRIQYVDDGITNDDSDWCSDDLNYQYFDIKFLDFSLEITNYTMRTRGNQSVAPVSWVVQTKVNDKFENISYIKKGPYDEVSVATFRIYYNQKLKNIRIMQLESNMYPMGFPLCFCVKDIDLFGIVFKTKTVYDNYLSDRLICFAIYMVPVFID